MSQRTLDYANCLDERVGNHGIAADDLEPLFPACCGIDIDALLDGAAMDQRCHNGNAADNPAAILACLLCLLADHGKPMHVLMPHATNPREHIHMTTTSSLPTPAASLPTPDY